MIIALVMLIIVIHMSAVWLWYKIINNPSVVDVGWASGITLSGLLYICAQQLSWRTIILAGALLLWGLRLGGYLWWTRIRKKHVDKRYISLSSTWNIKQSWGFFINFQFQGVLIFIVSLSWYFIAQGANKFTIIELIALIIFIISLVLEALADWQLSAFKKNNPGQVCNQGLWRYSRHPNCFFEWLVWCSFALLAISAPYGFLAFISPLALYVIMVYLTIPITEQESLRSRGEKYAQYQLITPKFFIGFSDDY